MDASGPSFDVAIVGGGLAGASLAVALRELPLSVALIEAHAPDSAAQPSFDERTTALGNASRRMFEALGLWRRLSAEAAPITSIHVSDAGRFGFARLEAREFGQEALGYVVPNRVLGRELWRALAAAPRISAFMPARLDTLRVQDGLARLAIRQDGDAVTIGARLVVAADGAQSLVRKVAGLGVTVDDYGQQAIVAALRTDQHGGGVAYERFTNAGPMALLPVRGPHGAAWHTLVWAAAPADAQHLMQLPDAQFMREWQQAFGWRAGRALQLGTRGRYPLALTRSSGSVAPRIVLLGNAAQSLHPVAGQGFNLALRDVATLAGMLARAGDADIGATEWLAGFEADRGHDRDGVVGFTDTLVRVFGSRHPAVMAARDAGLLLFDLLPPARRALSRVSLGFGRRAPRLARGLLPDAAP
ncbi:MAG TPA: 2-octaprenyl-6-methoxyphenyl hydroxylase [Steroidobacteraceae bacterium]|nr:2-octaprenyl-6-methoxyphenyl hydroxylase [Steroidobacteraceae bacterium]